MTSSAASPVNGESISDSVSARLLPHVERFESALRRGERPTADAYAAAVGHQDRAALKAELARVEQQYLASRESSAVTISSSGDSCDSCNGAAGDPLVEIGCPECGSPVPLATADPHVCPACQARFRIDRDSTLGWAKDRPRQLGKFELLHEVGRGAFGTVYKARDVALDRIVAVKVPRGGRFGSTDAEDRFAREARAAAQLRHPGIVQVFEVGRSEDCPFIVSEFVEGLTLADTLTGKRFAPREAADLAAQIAYALDHAHRMGVVHRDLKPSNIMLERVEARESTSGGDSTVSSSGATRRSGSETQASARSRGSDARPRITELEFRPRIMDFGLARRDEGEVTVTIDGQVLGTPAYMSPEQARGEGHGVDARGDTYSLGAILYELLTGELPFRGNKQMMLYQVIHDEPASPRRLNNRIPRDLETICLKCLAKEPARRYATCLELAEDLDRFLRDQPILARPSGRAERFWRWCRREPWIAGLSAAILLTLTTATIVSTIAFARAAANARQAEQSAETAASREREAKAAEAQAKADRAKAIESQSAAEREAETSRRTADFLASLMGSGDPFALDRFGVTGMRQTGFRLPSENIDELTVKVLLERGEALLQTELREHPLVRAKLLQAIGNAWHGLGFYDKAEPLFRESIDLFGQSGLPERERDLQAADVRFNLAWLLADKGHSLEARELFQRAHDSFTKHLPEDDARISLTLIGQLAVIDVDNRLEEQEKRSALFAIVSSNNKMAKSLGPAIFLYWQASEFHGRAKQSKQSADFEAAERVYVKLLQLAESEAGPEHVATAMALGALAGLHRDRGNYVQAGECIDKALKTSRNTVGSHPRMIEPLEVYGQLLESRGDYDLAIASYNDVIKIRRKHYPERVDNIAGVLEWMGNAQRRRGDLKAALDAYRESMRVQVDTSRTALRNLRVAQCMLDSGDLSGAVTTYDEKVQPHFAALPPLVRAAESENCIPLLRAAGRHEAAEQLWEESLKIAREQLESPNQHKDHLQQIGMILRRNREWEAVIRAWRAWVAGQAAWHVVDHAEVGPARVELAGALREQAQDWRAELERNAADTTSGKALPDRRAAIKDRLREARQECEAALEILRRQRGEDDWFTTCAKFEMARIAAAEGDSVSALSLASDALAAARRRFPKQNQPHEHPLIADALQQAAAIYSSCGKPDQAITLLEEALAIRRSRFPAAHPAILEVSQELADLCASQGDSARAEELRRQPDAASSASPR